MSLTCKCCFLLLLPLPLPPPPPPLLLLLLLLLLLRVLRARSVTFEPLALPQADSRQIVISATVSRVLTMVTTLLLFAGLDGRLQLRARQSCCQLRCLYITTPPPPNPPLCPRPPQYRSAS